MPTDQLSRTFGALADPTRRALLVRLSSGEATVTELAEPFPVSLQAVSKHLKVLEHAGLVTRGKQARWRPARIDGARLQEAQAWFGDFQKFWEGTFDKLDEHLRSLQIDPPATESEDVTP
jgi:DNA-binding transcriptional ArsR family regulator